MPSNCVFKAPKIRITVPASFENIDKAPVINKPTVTLFSRLFYWSVARKVTLHIHIERSMINQLKEIYSAPTTRVLQGVYKNQSVVMKEFTIKNDFEKEDFMTELSLLAICDHPKIIKIVGANSTDEDAFIVSPFYPKGTLKDQLFTRKKENKPWPLTELLQIILDCALVIQALHAINIVHHDIKPANFLVSAVFFLSSNFLSFFISSRFLITKTLF